MRGIVVIAEMTFLEARRNRIAWSIVFFCLVLVLASFMFQEVTIASYDRVVRDVGLGAIDAFGVILAIFLGANVFTRDIERRAVYPVLAKPISRVQYLLGKLLGVWATIVVCLGLMLGAFLLESVLYRGPLTAIVFETFWLILVELLVLASFAILTSTFTSVLLSAFMTGGVFLIGHFSEDLYFFAIKSHNVVEQVVGMALFYLLPNLDKLNLKTEASTLTPVSFSHVLGATGYGFMYAGMFIVLAMAIFQRRDLK